MRQEGFEEGLKQGILLPAKLLDLAGRSLGGLVNDLRTPKVLLDIMRLRMLALVRLRWKRKRSIAECENEL